MSLEAQEGQEGQEDLAVDQKGSEAREVSVAVEVVVAAEATARPTTTSVHRRVKPAINRANGSYMMRSL